jgi:hypothetical protein
LKPKNLQKDQRAEAPMVYITVAAEAMVGATAVTDMRVTAAATRWGRVAGACSEIPIKSCNGSEEQHCATPGCNFGKKSDDEYKETKENGIMTSTAKRARMNSGGVTWKVAQGEVFATS